MLELVHLAGGQTAPPLSVKQQLQLQQQQESSHGEAIEAGTGNSGGEEGHRGLDLQQPLWWQTTAVSALTRAGLRPGELALVLGRHFSVR